MTCYLLGNPLDLLQLNGLSPEPGEHIQREISADYSEYSKMAKQGGHKGTYVF